MASFTSISAFYYETSLREIKASVINTAFICVWILCQLQMLSFLRKFNLICTKAPWWEQRAREIKKKIEKLLEDLQFLTCGFNRGKWPFVSLFISTKIKVHFQKEHRPKSSCNLPCTMRWTREVLGWLSVCTEQVYGPSSYTSTFWIMILYWVGVLTKMITRGSMDHLSFPA